MTNQGIKLEVVVCRVGEHDVRQAGLGRGGGRCGGLAGLTAGLRVTRLVSEPVNLQQLGHHLYYNYPATHYLVPEQTVGDELLRVGYLPTHRALPPLVLNDPVPGALVTSRA